MQPCTISLPAYLATRNINVIGVDWGALSPSSNYLLSVANTRVVGAHVAELINFLVAQGAARLQDIHIIGFSLGAHVAGFAGKNTNGRVARITGLYCSFEETSLGLGPSSSVSNTSFQTAVY